MINRLGPTSAAVSIIVGPSGGGGGGPLPPTIVVSPIGSVVTPPPVVAGILFGSNKLNAITTTPNVTSELQDMWDVGGRCVRIDAKQASFNSGIGGLAGIISIAQTIGFQQFVLICRANLLDTGGTLPSASAFASEAAALAAANPDCYIELSNEPNLNPLANAALPGNGISAAQYATLAKAAYAAIKNAGVNTKPVLLGGIGNSSSVVNGLSMHGWCVALVANGCVLNAGFDWAVYHNYKDPVVDEAWWHLYTLAPTPLVAGDNRNVSGESCQSVFGNPPFAMTEFGDALSFQAGTTAQKEATQASHIQGWMQAFKAQPKCQMALQFALGDEFNAGPSADGFGLRRLDLTHRPSWDSYLTQATTP